jgi:glycerol dehydrogenase
LTHKDINESFKSSDISYKFLETITSLSNMCLHDASFKNLIKVEELAKDTNNTFSNLSDEFTAEAIAQAILVVNELGGVKPSKLIFI